MRQNEKISKIMQTVFPYIDTIEGNFSNFDQYALSFPSSPVTIEHKGEKIALKPKSPISIGFKQEALTIIDECTADILNFQYQNLGPLYNYLDDKYVSDFLISLASGTKQSSDPNKYNIILNRIDDFIKQLKITNYSAYVKIGNLKVLREHDFNSFKFFPNSEKYLDNLIGDKIKIHKEKILSKFSKDSNVFQVIIEIKIKAIDQENATKKAMQTVSDILNVLRVLDLIGIIYEGEPAPRFYDVHLLDRDSEKLSRIAKIEESYKMDVVYDFDKFVDDNPQYIKKLQTLFDPENSNLLEIKMKNSLIWLGESISEPNRSHQLLKMIISLESLLLDPDDRGTKSYLLEERAAFLLADNYEERCRIATTIKKCYGTRNSIVHSGDKHPIPLRLVQYLFTYVYDLNMLFLTTEKFRTFDDVRQAVLDEKFQKPF